MFQNGVLLILSKYVQKVTQKVSNIEQMQNISLVILLEYFLLPDLICICFASKPFCFEKNHDSYLT